MLIVGIGGTFRPGSSTEMALEIALEAASRQGAETRLFGGEALVAIPHFGLPDGGERGVARARQLIESIRQADGLIIASPGYHGAVSGLVKNAIDHVEATASDARPYLDGLPVGLIATAYGWQAAVTTVTSLRAIVHALRGWPTPFAASVRTTPETFREGRCCDPDVERQLKMVGQQVAGFASLAPRHWAVVEAAE